MTDKQLIKYKNELSEDINRFETTIKSHCEGINEINKRSELNKLSIEIMNANIYKFNDDFKSIETRFDTTLKQNKIFYNNIKECKTRLDVITKDRISYSEFKDRLNSIVINIQERLEKLEDKILKEKKVSKKDSIDIDKYKKNRKYL